MLTIKPIYVKRSTAYYAVINRGDFFETLSEHRHKFPDR